MKNKKVSVMVPILWIFSTVGWTISFIRNLEYRGLSDTSLVILQGATVLLSLAAAIISINSYIKTK